MTTKWTNGPWRYAPLLDRIVGPDGQEIARTFGTDIDYEQEDANAQLIASTPALYEALEKLVHTAQNASLFGESLYAAPVVKAAQAALRQARGEQ